MRKIGLLLVLFLSVILGYTQSSRQVEDGLFKVNALLPGISYELGIANKATITFEGFIAFTLEGGTNRSTEFGIYPGLQAEYRYFVNMDRRISKNKNISGNSGNYVGFLNQFQTGNPVIGDLEFNSDYFYNVGVVYGIQRTTPRGLYWGISFGPGVLVDQFGTDLGLIIDGRLGWVIGGRKKK